jgi:hemolysin activation/secretion protein
MRANQEMPRIRECVALALLLMTSPAAPAQVDTGDGAIEQPLGPRRQELTEPEAPQPSPGDIQLAPAAPPGAEAAATGGMRFLVRKFRFIGNTVIETRVLETVAAPFEGREITDAELQELRRRLIAVYADAGFVTSTVVIPDQQIVDGVIEMRLVENRLGAVELTGLRQFDEDFLRRRIVSGIEQPIRARQLEEHLLAVLQDPAIAGLRPQLVIGDDPSLSTLRVDVREARQYGARISTADDRSPAIGGIRGELELYARNLLGRGDLTTISLEASQGLQVVDARTDVPINVHGTRFQFRYADYDARVIEEPLEDLNIESESRILELGLQQDLFRTSGRLVSAGISLDGRDSDSFLDGRPFSFSRGAENGRARIRVARIRVSWLERARRDVFSAQAQFSGGLDVLDATVHDDGRPDSEFLTGMFAAQWLHSFGGPWGQLYSRFQIQKSDDALLPLEKMAIGGTRSVRGYRRARHIRDSAWDASFEFRLPVGRIPVPGLSGESEGRFTAVAFVDAGRAWNEANGEDEGNRTLIGAGPGLRWDVMRGLRVELYWAAADRDLDFEKNDIQDHGLHFQVAYQTQF